MRNTGEREICGTPCSSVPSCSSASLIAGELMTRQHRRLVPGAKQKLRRLASQHVDDHRSRDSRKWAGPPIESLKFDNAIARRAAVVDHDVRHVDQLLSGGVRRRCVATVLNRNNRYHRESATPGVLSHLYDYRSYATRRDHNDGVVWPKAITLENALGSSLRISQETTLAATRSAPRRQRTSKAPYAPWERNQQNNPAEEPFRRREAASVRCRRGTPGRHGGCFRHTPWPLRWMFGSCVRSRSFKRSIA